MTPSACVLRDVLGHTHTMNKIEGYIVIVALETIILELLSQSLVYYKTLQLSKEA